MIANRTRMAYQRGALALIAQTLSVGDSQW